MAKQISVKEYIDSLDYYPEINQPPKIGGLYFFGYVLSDNITARANQLKFYDFFPAVFVYSVDIKNKKFMGFNIHQIEPNSRRKWIEMIQRFVSQDKLDPAKFVTLKRLFTTSRISIEPFEMRRVRHLREVPYSNWDETFDEYANTTFGATIAEVTAKYLSYLK